MNMQAKKGAVLEQDVTTLYTIGYEKRSIAEYVSILLSNEISLVVDVRKNPLSRKKGFSKRALSLALEEAGIVYQHLPQLGIASSLRKNLAGPDDYRALFDHYEKEILPGNEASLLAIETLLQRFDRVALTCFELDPDSCHRHCVAKTFEGRFPIIDL